jgi:hypothetical protein
MRFAALVTLGSQLPFAAIRLNVRFADKAAVQFLCFVDAASVCGCSMFMLRCSLSR